MDSAIKDILASPQLLASVPAATVQQWSEQYPHIPLFRIYALLNQPERDHTTVQQTAFYTHNRALLYQLLTQPDSKLHHPSAETPTVIPAAEPVEAITENIVPVTTENTVAATAVPQIQEIEAAVQETPVAEEKQETALQVPTADIIAETPVNIAPTPTKPLSVAERILAELQEMKAERERIKSGVRENTAAYDDTTPEEVLQTTESTVTENITDNEVITHYDIDEPEMNSATSAAITATEDIYIPETADMQLPTETPDNFGEEVVTAELPDTADNTHYDSDEAEVVSIPTTAQKAPLFIPTIQDIVITDKQPPVTENIPEKTEIIEAFIEPDTDVIPVITEKPKDIVFVPEKITKPEAPDITIPEVPATAITAVGEIVVTDSILPLSTDKSTAITEMKQVTEQKTAEIIDTYDAQPESPVVPDIQQLETEAPHTFVEWLQLLDGQLQIQTAAPAPVIEEKEWIAIPRYEVEQTIAHKKEIQAEENKLFEPVFEEGEVDLFNEIDEEVTKVATESVQFRQDMMTETLAKIYTKQGKTDKALEIYNALLLKFPEKSAYFAGLIEKLQKEQ
ncbi:MAG TPA: hypothetical protein PLA16_07780 [Chitinophagales bacterium]|nr:hypothetical protein [Chitinophagales bacterium]